MAEPVTPVATKMLQAELWPRCVTPVTESPSRGCFHFNQRMFAPWENAPSLLHRPLGGTAEHGHTVGLSFASHRRAIKIAKRDSVHLDDEKMCTDWCEIQSVGLGVQLSHFLWFTPGADTGCAGSGMQWSKMWDKQERWLRERKICCPLKRICHYKPAESS